MDVSILSDTNNPVVDRREVRFSVVEDDRTVSKEEVKKEICKQLNMSPDFTIIVEIKQEFGVRRSSGLAHSYKSKEALERAEPKYLIARLAKKNAKKEGGAEAAAAPAEAPKEEKKKEKKEHKEEKKEDKKE